MPHFELSVAQQQLRETARRFASGQISPVARLLREATSQARHWEHMQPVYFNVSATARVIRSCSENLLNNAWIGDGCDGTHDMLGLSVTGSLEMMCFEPPPGTGGTAA